VTTTKKAAIRAPMTVFELAGSLSGTDHTHVKGGKNIGVVRHGFRKIFTAFNIIRYAQKNISQPVVISLLRHEPETGQEGNTGTQYQSELTVQIYDFLGPYPPHQPISPIGTCAFCHFFFFLF
jgi:hypothetical protein